MEGSPSEESSLNGSGEADASVEEGVVVEAVEEEATATWRARG